MLSKRIDINKNKNIERIEVHGEHISHFDFYQCDSCDPIRSDGEIVKFINFADFEKFVKPYIIVYFEDAVIPYEFWIDVEDNTICVFFC